MVLQAYFDASKRANGTFCVAGYAFTKRQLRMFDKDWWKLFSKYGGCHMKELINRKGRFKGITQHEADHLVRSAVPIINKHISFGIVISCNAGEMASVLPRWIRGLEHAYPVCCHLAMTKLGNVLSDRSTHRVAYFFESGDEYSGCAQEFMKNAERVPALKEEYRHASHACIPKEDALALQAADMLAWEWAKFRDETIETRVRPIRKSLSALVTRDGSFNDKQYFGHHITGAPLRRFCEQARQLGLMQIAEENVKKAAR